MLMPSLGVYPCKKDLYLNVYTKGLTIPRKSHTGYTELELVYQLLGLAWLLQFSGRQIFPRLIESFL